MAVRLGAVALAICALAYGCGGDEGDDEVEVVKLAKCTDEGGLTAAGWGGSVGGISCRQAGSFIQNHALRDFPVARTSTRAAIRHTEPGNYTSDGFDCEYQPMSSGWGFRVACTRPGEAVSFGITP